MTLTLECLFSFAILRTLLYRKIPFIHDDFTPRKAGCPVEFYAVCIMCISFYVPIESTM